MLNARAGPTYANVWSLCKAERPDPVTLLPKGVEVKTATPSVDDEFTKFAVVRATFPQELATETEWEQAIADPTALFRRIFANPPEMKIGKSMEEKKGLMKAVNALITMREDKAKELFITSATKVDVSDGQRWRPRMGSTTLG